MTEEEARTLAQRIAAHVAPNSAQAVSCLEIFGPPDDSTWCCEITVPGEDRPTDTVKLMARIVESEWQWKQRVKEDALVARLFKQVEWL